ncbi:M15 family metallopeptidase [Aquimarina sp. 2201CG1-2-11]|uniref:M15 family metallopeptidase n=1 Tax=Aquimarina discodermiae TaxID=3231043 RepID=UPI003462F511
MMRISFKPNTTGKVVMILTVAIVVAVILFRKRKAIKAITTDAINYLKMKTWDIYTDRRINTLHPKIRAKAKEFIIRAEKELGIKLRVTSGFRTWEEQTELYNKGRISPGKRVTNAKAGQSYHNYGLALDVVEIKNGKAIWNNPNWKRIADIGKSLGFEWGGDWKFIDKPHFQMRFGKHHTELAKLYRSGEREGKYILI